MQKQIASKLLVKSNENDAAKKKKTKNKPASQTFKMNRMELTRFFLLLFPLVLYLIKQNQNADTRI